ncbi:MULTISPECIES: phosphotransferase [unclassified Streptomyces]|uniref:phosphotransferase n=1 Tax=unclassified Streptomyces TaxID=2593676 RepID=UPI00224CC3B5|nr:MULTISPECIES: phosphotransferase [unclassified Streptomyces]WSP53187.1 hypothetical protein OG306_01140 [Streptomyces sp. NBC_01241]WSU26095.1 hypothetical protein OG508_37865 [Streptomyces sp. NBC_01108]MCX4792139.1 hypothetical protein [Streptomyces sp. NBC_01221]MCX4799520.1 hypothetical protein [Streptomyces sp. NBC_01242]WSJ40656.1 hypothetical protein OG772_35095 [Streptomyces sp. NBC_01321]
MSSDRWSTHSIEMGPDSVIKRFRREDRERCEREWRALKLLDAYVPGLAPEPRDADLAAVVPTVVMSRLNGMPLRGGPIADGQLRALAEAVTTLHAAVPEGVLTELPLRPGHQGELIAHVHTWSTHAHPQVSGRASRAMDAGLAWLTQ